MVQPWGPQCREAWRSLQRAAACCAQPGREPARQPSEHAGGRVHGHVGVCLGESLCCLLSHCCFLCIVAWELSTESRQARWPQDAW